MRRKTALYTATKRASKTNARKCVVEGIEFDSKREGKRYVELRERADRGEILNLTRQIKYELIPKQVDERGKVIERKVEYTSDFEYDLPDGTHIVEDCKGFRDTSSAMYAKFVIKRKLMLWRYGIRIIET